MDTPARSPFEAAIFFRLSALFILVILGVSLGWSLASNRPPTTLQVVAVTAVSPSPTPAWWNVPACALSENSLAYRIKSGRPFDVVFDQTAGKFDDTRYAGSSKTDPMGNLKGGETYAVRYDLELGEWTTTGYNQGTGSVITRAYRNARPEECALSLWGRTYRFDDDGQVYDSQFGPVGRIEMP